MFRNISDVHKVTTFKCMSVSRNMYVSHMSKQNHMFLRFLQSEIFKNLVDLFDLDGRSFAFIVLRNQVNGTVFTGYNNVLIGNDPHSPAFPFAFRFHSQLGLKQATAERSSLCTLILSCFNKLFKLAFQVPVFFQEPFSIVLKVVK